MKAGQVVLLRFRPELLRTLVEDELGRGRAGLLRRRDRRDERDLATGLDDLVGGLASRVKLPMARGVIVRRVENRSLEESGVHGGVNDGRKTQGASGQEGGAEGASPYRKRCREGVYTVPPPRNSLPRGRLQPRHYANAEPNTLG